MNRTTIKNISEGLNINLYFKFDISSKSANFGHCCIFSGNTQPLS